MHTILSLVLIRRLVLITLLILPQRFWFYRGWKLSARSPQLVWKLAGRVFLVLSEIAIALVLYDRVFHKFIPHAASRWIGPIIQLWVFTSSFAYFCVKIVHAVEWIWHQFAGRRVLSTKESVCRTLSESRVREKVAYKSEASRRVFFRYAACFVGGLPFFAAFYGFARERLNFKVVRVDVPIPDLPAALDGLRIVQFSDIHIGDFMPREEIRRAVDMANALSPHLAVITGDLVTDQGDPLADCISELSCLSAPLGIWGCNGNHEIYAGAEDAAEALFRDRGMTMLRSTNAQVSWNGAHINLIGVDYQRNVEVTAKLMPKLVGIDSLVRSDMPNILLSHNPNSFYRAADLGIELTLAGHTHGGQINVEIVNHSWSPARFMTNFIAGLYRLPMRTIATPSPAPAEVNFTVLPNRTVPLNGTAPDRTAPPASDQTASRTLLAHLYVNRGLGTLAIPARLGAQPEITLLTLRSPAKPASALT